MKIFGILWLILHAASLSGEEVPENVFVLGESCTEGACEGEHVYEEKLFSQAEQGNEDIFVRSSAEQMSDSADVNFRDDKFTPDSGLFDEVSPSSQDEKDVFGEHYDGGNLPSEHHENLDVSRGHCKGDCESTETESSLGSEEADQKDILSASEEMENQQLEASSPELEVVGVDRVKKEKNDSDGSQRETRDTQPEQTISRQRYVPLLYTIRTLLNSLMSEFGEEGGNQDVSFNSSDATVGNMTAAEDLIKEINGTVNGTESGKKTRFQCAIKNVTSNTTGEVKIVNSTELLEILNFSKNQKVSPCVLVMFYAPWCHFCARTAPHYNALAKAFPQLDVLAVDTSHFSYLNARFGTVAVPNVMLFHARSAVRFNHTARVLDNFIQFVTNNTGLDPDRNVKLEPAHFIGPLPSVVVQGRDWLLWLSWTFVIICSVYGFVRSHYGQSFITRLRVLWQEHQHIE